jgi:hypothetical protein
MPLGQVFGFMCYIALIVNYSVSLHELMKISPQMLQFIVENKCSDEVLQFAFEKFNKDYERSLTLLSIGLAFSVIALTVIVVMAVLVIFNRKFKVCFDDKPPRSPKADARLTKR